jgi:cyclopropane fatty-acyl-phospholipid synthase-like methyltransferase
MSENTTGLRRVLSVPAAYSFLQDFLGGNKGRRTFVLDHVRASPNQRVLEIGCGTAQNLDYLPPVDYVGFDASAEYVEAAHGRYPGRGTFICESLTTTSVRDLRPFDVVIASGIMHHLDDDEVDSMLALASAALVEGGRLVTIDPCFTDPQSAVARFVISKDRGQNVRSLQQYEQLVKSAFPEHIATVRTDLLRIPYTHAIFECRKGVGSPPRASTLTAARG